MAISTTNTAPVGGLFRSPLATLVSAITGWNDERMTRKSLSTLSVRELDDIGLCRGDIDNIARLGRRL
ncbi:DUF1127 domain-containing protein [Pseudoroseicyclus tamaricis]|uniref:DUF1127 domain-containing protein n=1 Tax=Pseudoroseicyclus tamaricis TaxID=2705421 RepID=A0A6B2JK52_9RHOB|nr:DUF1127 domain-containing protein [Pseudoroseicyclus tamaricis]NDV01851.1 DUF1127 domain-containing protein [Pseudoroseicyclus tamaricis]